MRVHLDQFVDRAGDVLGVAGCQREPANGLASSPVILFSHPLRPIVGPYFSRMRLLILKFLFKSGSCLTPCFGRNCPPEAPKSKPIVLRSFWLSSFGLSMSGVATMSLIAIALHRSSYAFGLTVLTLIAGPPSFRTTICSLLLSLYPTHVTFTFRQLWPNFHLTELCLHLSTPNFTMRAETVRRPHHSIQIL